jgi:hypothetical protein
METDMDVAAHEKTPVLIVGNDGHADFAEVRAFLNAQAAIRRFYPHSFKHPSRLIVVFQSRPGEISQATIEQAYRTSPLAPVLAVLGSWCEGEMRSGRPWHGVERVYWYDAIGRLTSLLGGCRSLTALRTQTPAEQIERSLPCRFVHESNAMAAIISPWRVTADAWGHALRSLGYQTQWHRHAEQIMSSPRLLLWDTDDLGDSRLLPQIQQTKLRFPQAKQLAVLNFPRQDEVNTLAASGVLTLGKPLLLADLAGALEHRTTHAILGPAAVA